MKVSDLVKVSELDVVHMGEDCEIKNIFCCDLLSIAMSRMPESAVWVTVMGNVNTLAVAELTDVSVIILAEGTTLDPVAKEKLKVEEISVFATSQPIFDIAVAIKETMNG